MYLKKLNKNGLSVGFTIIETLIFLAVSSALFVSVAFLISGQINRYQAKDAMNQVESVVRGVLNDVTNGYYPLVGQNVSSCNRGVDKPTYVTAAGSENRGEHLQCIIVGKSITFNSNNIEVNTYIANDTVTSPLTIANLTPVTELKEIKDYKWQIKPTTTKTFYILNTNFGSGATNFVSGAQSAQLYDQSLGTVAYGSNTVDFDNGERTSSLIFLTDGSLGVSVKY